MGRHALTARKSVSDVLKRCWAKGVMVQSNFARSNDREIAALASLGFITTKEGPYSFGRTWRVTPDGLQFLKHEGCL